MFSKMLYDKYYVFFIFQKRNILSSIELPLHDKQMADGNSDFIVWRRGFGNMPRLLRQHYEDTQNNPCCSSLNPGLGQNSEQSFCNTGLQSPLVH